MILQPTNFPVGSQRFDPAGSHIRGDRQDLLFYWDPRYPFWYRDQLNNPIDPYKQWTHQEREYLTVVDNFTLIFNELFLYGTENIDLRAKDLTILAAVWGSGEKFTLPDRLRLSTGTNGDPNLTHWSSTSGLERQYKFHSTNPGLNEYGVNVLAYAIPQVPSAASDLRMARNGYVRDGRENFGNGDPYYGLAETTLGNRWMLNRSAGSEDSGVGLLKIWDRMLSDEELAAETGMYAQTFGPRISTQVTSVPKVDAAASTTWDVAGVLEVSSSTSWDLPGNGELGASAATTWDVFYAMIVARGTYWEIQRRASRSVFAEPKDGDLDINVITPAVLRLDRYENVAPNALTTKWKWSAGVSSTFTITRVGPGASVFLTMAIGEMIVDAEGGQVFVSEAGPTAQVGLTGFGMELEDRFPPASLSLVGFSYDQVSVPSSDQGEVGPSLDLTAWAYEPAVAPPQTSEENVSPAMELLSWAYESPLVPGGTAVESPESPMEFVGWEHREVSVPVEKTASPLPASSISLISWAYEQP